MAKHRKRRETYTATLPIGRWVEFPVHGTRIMPRAPALYALYRDRTLVYIGQSVNIRARFSTAYRRRTDLTLAKLRVVASVTELAALEQRLIRRLRPIDNHEYSGRHRAHPRRRLSYDE